MKVAFVYDLVYPFGKGGVEKRIWDLSRQLSARGHETHIFGNKHWPGPAVFNSEGVVVRGVGRPRPLYTRNGRRSIPQAVLFAVVVGRDLAKDRFDVIEAQATQPLVCLVAWVVAKLRRSQLIVVWHEVWGRAWLSYLGPLGNVGRFLDYICAKLSRTVLAVSATTAGRLREMGVDGVIRVPVGVDLDHIADLPVGLRRSDVIFVGRLIREKNVHLLIEAAAKLRDEGVIVDVLVVGDGPERIELEALAAGLGLDHIVFTGFVDGHDEVLSLMKSSKVLALPSGREGFGTVVLEAAACGLPTVTIQHVDNAATELVADSKTGLVCLPTSGELAAALKKLVLHDGFRMSLGEEARRAVTQFDWMYVASQVEDIFMLALQKGAVTNR